jgi:hypothetical protein
LYRYIKGTAAILQKLQSLPFQQVKHQMVTIDCQPTPGKGWHFSQRGWHFSKRVGTFPHHVILRIKIQFMTASMVHVINLTPGSSQSHSLKTPGDDSHCGPCNQSDARECQP